MRERRPRFGRIHVLPLITGLLLTACASHPQSQVPFVVTPHPVVNEMLRLAAVTKDDVVYDLGSGDGRLVVAAARDFGARGVGIEIEPRLVTASTGYAKSAGVADRVTFVQQDFFQTDLRPATVVTLFLGNDLNLRLRPKLLQELRPGARIVSHNFDMGDWQPARMIRVEADGQSRPVYLWVVPPRP
jgi:hypothetical protein